MNETLQECLAILAEFGFSTQHVEIPADEDRRPLETLAFEDEIVIGFVVVYETVAELIISWKGDGNRIAMRHRAALQAARQKAWNTYLVLVSRETADSGQSLVLGQIEEDLEAMRKITKAGIIGAEGARGALLPLLPFRAAPSLAPVNMHEEIVARTTELSEQVVAAFLSNADDAVIMQLLEDRS